MTERYFFAVRYLLPETDPALVAGRCISVLHGFVAKQNSNSIGVAFPSWSTDSLGNSIAFVSKESSLLDDFASQPYFQAMQGEGFVESTSLLNVPEGLGEVRFVRNQRAAKMFPGEKRRRLKRAKKRAAERGEDFVPVISSLVQEESLLHPILMDSKSSQQRYLLFIQKEEVEEPVYDYNSYGFATLQERLGTVPDLAEINLFSQELPKAF